MMEDIYTLIKDAGSKEIRPLTEEPTTTLTTVNHPLKTTLTAAELFSQFTANIIKEEKIFTR